LECDENQPESAFNTGGRKWIEEERESIAPVCGHPRPAIAMARGSELTDVEGNRYLDFSGGAHVCNLGYSHPEIIEVTKQQMDELDFVPHWSTICNMRVQLAQSLREKAPGTLKKGKVAYCNTGSEATEFSIKLARYATRRSSLLACLGAYHGGTLGALSLTVDDSGFRRNYSPFLPNVFYIPYANCYRCFFGDRYPKCNLRCIKFIRYLFDTVIHPGEVAAVFVEPIQGHGGVIVPPTEYFVKLRELCSKEQILLIDDEVIAGFGRTGKMFGIEHYDIEPDVMFFGKSIGSGIPLGAILAKKHLMESWESGGPASTTAANLLACARALTLIEIISRENLISKSHRLGEYFMNRLCEMAEDYPLIGDVRGRGLLIGIELVQNRETRVPADKRASDLIEIAYKRGLLMATIGTYKNTIEIAPPLNITQEQADRGLRLLEESFRELTQSRAP
jgi:4-aminobutyrate aminotransferase